MTTLAIVISVLALAVSMLTLVGLRRRDGDVVAVFTERRTARGRDSAPAYRRTQEIDADEARRMIAGSHEDDLVVVDVRTRCEFGSGHVPGARWVPLEDLRVRYTEIPTDRRVLLFCAVGMRSGAACAFLMRKGYEDVINVAGGMTAYTGPLEVGLPATENSGLVLLPARGPGMESDGEREFCYS